DGHDRAGSGAWSRSADRVDRAGEIRRSRRGGALVARDVAVLRPGVASRVFRRTRARDPRLGGGRATPRGAAPHERGRGRSRRARAMVAGADFVNTGLWIKR